LGTVGLDWQFAGFGNFASLGQSDMILRNGNTGALQVYDIANNQITSSAALGTVGLDWQVGGFGNFSSRGTSDMIMGNTVSGGLQVYDIDHNQITGTAFLGAVGSDWRVSGVGNFSSVPGESDLIMRNTTTGGLQVYNIANNQIVGSAFLGTVGLDWQFAGVAPVQGAGTSDLVLRNVNSGAFQVYNIANNQITGSASLGLVGLDWQLGGLTANPPAGAIGGAASNAQLVQANGRFRRRRGRHVGCRPACGRHVTAAVADDAAARVTVASTPGQACRCIASGRPIRAPRIAQRRYRRSRNVSPDRRIARLSPWRLGDAQRSRSVTCTTPRSCFVPRESPLFSNTFSIGILSGKTSAIRVSSPARRAIAARWRMSAAPIPCPWYSSTMAKATSASPGSTTT
jgi:hypothetical protein